MSLARLAVAVPAGIFGFGVVSGFCFCLGVTTAIGLAAISNGRGPL